MSLNKALPVGFPIYRLVRTPEQAMFITLIAVVHLIYVAILASLLSFTQISSIIL